MWARARRSGTTGWVVIAGFAVLWDVAHIERGETLSSAFARAARHPFHRWPLTMAWAVLTLHLYDHLPTRYDPFHRVATHVIRRIRA